MNHGNGKTAESIFIASLFIITSDELAKIFNLLGDFENFDKYHTMSKRMKQKTNTIFFMAYFFNY